VGQYNFERDNLLKKSSSTFNIKKETSNFLLPSNCKKIKVNLYDPLMKEEEGRTVGPGYYNIDRDSLAYKSLEKMTSSMFSSGY
jgi:hypothetical protein